VESLIKNYSFAPEEPIDEKTYLNWLSKIDQAKIEGYNAKHVECEGEVCPIDFDQNDSERDALLASQNVTPQTEASA
jgi:hypothetical protein